MPHIFGGISNKSYKLLCFYLLGGVNYNLAAVVHFAFVPVRSVKQVRLASGRIYRKGGSSSLVVGSSFVPSCFRGFSLWMCHFILLFVR